MNKMANKTEPNSVLKETLKHIQVALDEWDKIPDSAESETEVFRKKTRDLLIKLNEQIKALNL
jgi:hypothetical protein